MEKAIQLRPMSMDVYTGSDLLINRAVTLTMLGEHDPAVTQLEELLRIPSSVSKNFLRVNPILPLSRD